MANVVIQIGKQKDAAEDLEKYVDLDMDSVYKTFAHSAKLGKLSLNREQDSTESGQIAEEPPERDALIALNKSSKKPIDIDYSGYKIARNINVKAVQQAIHNIFTWLPGERILEPEFGTKLRQYLYEGIVPKTEELINAEIRQSIARWEPRARVVDIYNVSTTEDTEGNTMHLQIVYTIPSLSDKQYSYSFYYNKVV